MSARMDIRLAGEHDGAGWSTYLDQHPDATLFHDWRWRAALMAATGYDPVFLVAERGGEIVGVLPLIDVKSPLFGRALISTAFTVGGGVCADDGAICAALGAAAIDEGHSRRAGYIELRGGSVPGPDWQTKTGNHAGFSRRLEPTAEAMLMAIPRKRRAELRKAFKLQDAGRLVIREDDGPDLFYDLYAQSLRNLGTPVFGRRHIRSIAKAFAGNVRFTIAEYDSQPVVGLCTFYHGDTILPYYIGMTDAAREARAGDLVYWSLMKDGIERGLERFDFGRSKVGSPHELYKKTWGFDADPLTYGVALIGADALPDVNPNSPKFAMATAAWKRLPLWAANRIGPVVARNLA